MRNALSLYVDTSAGSTEELNRLIQEMEDEIAAQFSEKERSLISDNDRVYSKQGKFITLPVLENVTGYSVEQLSTFRTGKKDVPDHLIRHVRVLHRRVMEDPQLAYRAIHDWMSRKIEEYPEILNGD